MTDVVRKSPIVDSSGDHFLVSAVGGSGRYESHPLWMTGRQWEAAETTRLNEAHWSRAQDTPINVWLSEHLGTLRTRSIYESRQNGMVAGVIQTHVDGIVGADGPTLQVQSDDDAYNTALEQLWREWFASPTTRPSVSGTALLKLWIRSLWRCGEYLCRMVTDPNATGPVAMRLLPTHPRRLSTPIGLTGDQNTVMGIRFDSLNRPATYYITDVPMSGQTLGLTSQPYPVDLVIHEFVVDEEDQARGFPWLTPGLSPAADLRDYDDQVQDAARQQADASGLLYTEHPDAEFYAIPESTTIQRRTIKMVPPGWKPWQYAATQPPVQYPDYRGERLREIGRSQNIPLLMVRLDASKHNYSSARFDSQLFSLSAAGIQAWISGTEHSYGTLNRLVDEVAREARFRVPELRRRPARVSYRWTWPKLPHVDPAKERTGQTLGLASGVLSLTDALASEGRELESHVATLQRERQILEEAELPLPAWMQVAEAGKQAIRDQDAEEKQEANANG